MADNLFELAAVLVRADDVHGRPAAVALPAQVNRLAMQGQRARYPSRGEGRERARAPVEQDSAYLPLKTWRSGKSKRPRDNHHPF